MKVKLHIRIDSENLCHTQFTVFVNGENAGTLVMRNDEFDDLLAWMRLGKRENQFVVTRVDDDRLT